VPTAPTALAARAASGSQIDLSWGDNANDEEGFKIDRSSDGGATWTRIATPGANATGYSDTGLVAGATYTYKVKAYNAAGNSGDSNQASATTPAPAPPPAPAVPLVNGASFVSQVVPPGMTAGQSYPVSLTFKNTGTTTWTAADLHRLGAESPQNNLTWGAGRLALPAGVASVAPGASVTFSFTALAPSAPGAYAFQWRMVQDGKEWFGDFSPLLSVQVSAPATVAPSTLAAPSNLSASAGGKRGGPIKLSWSDNSGDETGFKIERSSGGGSFAVIATLGAGATGYQDASGTAGTAYAYRVRAFNAAGESAPSNTAQATKK
jgi:chitodextrinase